MLATAVVWFLLFREGGYGADRTYLFLGMMPVATIFTASTLMMVLVSLATPAPSEKTIRKFFPA